MIRETLKMLDGASFGSATVCYTLALFAACACAAPEETPAAVQQGGAAGSSLDSGGASGSTAGSAGSAGNGGSSGGGSGSAGVGGSSGSGGTAGTTATPDCTGPTLDPGDYTYTLEVDGATRTFDVHVPPSYTGDAAVPLFFWFHPFTTNREYAKTAGFLETADREGFITVMPDGVSNSWNAGACCGGAVTNDVDDVAFVRAMFADVTGKTCIDTRRVYAGGFSNGGFLSHRLACEASDIFAAIAADAGVLGIPQAECTPAHPIAVLHIHGTADSIIPYGGSATPIFGVTHEGFPSAADTVAFWAAKNGCTDTPTETFNDGETHCETQSACGSGGVEVSFCTVEGGGHCWFGEPSCPLGPNSAGFEASEAAWAFVSRFQR